NGLSQSVRVSAKCALPQRVAQDGCPGTLRTILIRRESSPDDRMEHQYVEILCRDPTSMNILHNGTGPKVRAGGPHRRHGGEQRGHVLARALPLLPIDGPSRIRGLRARRSGIEGPDAFRMRV